MSAPTADATNWATDAVTPTGVATIWATQRPGWVPSRPDWTFEPATADDRVPYLGVLPRPPADSTSYAFQVVMVEGRFLALEGAVSTIGSFDTLAAALTAGADFAEGVEAETAAAA
ncbi:MULTISPECIES: hypothetical protein [Roseomonadaceae]|uniref:Uncharacterized protein n=1 Tax=Falsiroseomonas oleicola TaxID=2801474 RepID=A0ABS6HAD1_9PROT|nr:hypothetical protein [Roseomonas oleicola]MBU8544782.1 hypothetical protein [Roseomonas oleicola]